MEMPLQLGDDRLHLTPALIAPDGRLNGIQNFLFAKGLRKKVYRARLHRPHRYPYVGMAADENDRQRNVRPEELLLQLQSVSVGQPYIQDQAMGSLRLQLP